ncbi:MAG: hypothetical protein AAFU77_15510 [Myxococcota bacterium]
MMWRQHAAALVGVFLFPATAHAYLDHLVLNVEPGLATLSEASGRSWGGGGAVSGSTNITERLSVQLHIDFKRFPNRNVPLDTTAWGGALVYNIDVGRVTPFLELGYGAVSIAIDDGGMFGPSEVPILGAGFNAVFADMFAWGFIVRYYPILDTDLLSNPAYVTINARIGVRLGGS